jgi:hypothetical protein
MASYAERTGGSKPRVYLFAPCPTCGKKIREGGCMQCGHAFCRKCDSMNFCSQCLDLIPPDKRDYYLQRSKKADSRYNVARVFLFIFIGFLVAIGLPIFYLESAGIFLFLLFLPIELSILIAGVIGIIISGATMGGIKKQMEDLASQLQAGLMPAQPSSPVFVNTQLVSAIGGEQPFRGQVHCMNCGASIDGQSCRNCGARRCMACGGLTMERNAEFCGSCGKSLPA